MTLVNSPLDAKSPCEFTSPANLSPKLSAGPLRDLDEMDDFRETFYTTDSVISDTSSENSSKDQTEDEDSTWVINSDKKESEFRNYESNPRLERVRNFYKDQHEKQTLDFVLSMEKKYSRLGKLRLGVWEALEKLNKYVDESDPDTNLTQMEHALQTAEAARKAYPGEKYDWLHLTALIHDMGKFLGAEYNEPQWAVVGDTFPVGMQHSEKNVFPEFFSKNPDTKNSKILNGGEYGIYQKGCGLKNVHMSWGHDEYLYNVCVQNKCTLPLSALYIIRYHSFYPWHKEGAYMGLCDATDLAMLEWVRKFNPLDLYSKSDSMPDVTKLAPYYKKAIKKYFPTEVNW